MAWGENKKGSGYKDEFFWNYSGYSYSSLGLKVFMEYQFSKNG